MKQLKKLMAVLLCLSLVLGTTGCGFNIGNVKGTEKYADLFPDAALENGKVYKHSHKAYTFSLPGYGQMTVYVDTSNGHSFDLQSENGGFNILDADGNIAFYAACLDADTYKTLTSTTQDTKKINGRTFFIRENDGDGSVDAFSYMADCGLDCGFVMENKYADTDVFSLVSFRGEPIPGSSSDPYEYKGTTDFTEYLTEDDLIDEYPEEVIENDLVAEELPDASSLVTTSGLSEETKAALSSLQTDFSKVAWGVVYTLSEEFPGFVVSVTPYSDYGQWYLVVGMTNLYDHNLRFSGSLTASDSDGNDIGNLYVYEPYIGSANTLISVIYCGENMPDGRIHWDEVELSVSNEDKYVAWETDYSVTGSPADGMLELNYEIYSANNEDMKNIPMEAFLLDENGFVVGRGSDYISDTITAGARQSSTISFYGDSDSLAKAKGIAMFANPIKP